MAQQKRFFMMAGDTFNARTAKQTYLAFPGRELWMVATARRASD